MRIKGGAQVNGILSVPGDKSISHRVAMMAAIAEGVSTITNFASSADCHSTLDCMQRLGARVERTASGLLIHGNGLRGLRPPETPARLDAGNSGSTIRMLSGILAGQPFNSVIDGDASLRRRPMRRIIEPLTKMGARVIARDESYAPLQIEGSRLRAIRYESPVASAQVKSCVLLAGLFAEGQTVFIEPAASRNHTELMLKEFGAQLDAEQSGRLLSIEGGQKLSAVEYRVPGDISSAAFFIAAAAMLKDSQIILRNVSLNPTRAGILEVMRSLGAAIFEDDIRLLHGEPVADIRVASSHLGCEKTVLSGEIIPNIIDEIPILAVLATQVEGMIEFRDAAELRVKESDRIKTIVAGIRSLGGAVEEFEDGFAIRGPQRLTGGRVETEGDHRIAMAFAIAGLIADGTTVIEDADAASVSFPEFYESLKMVAGEDRVE